MLNYKVFNSIMFIGELQAQMIGRPLFITKNK